MSTRNWSNTERLVIRGLPTGWLAAGPSEGAEGTMMFLHGFPDDARVWLPQLEHFSRTHRVLAPFLRGIGPSAGTRDRRRYGPDSVALDHLEILQATGAFERGPIVVVGHDIGGPHAWHLARLLRQRLRALVLINGPALDQMARRLRGPAQLARSWYLGVLLPPWLGEWAVEGWGKRLLVSARRTALGTEAGLPDGVSGLLWHYREGVRLALGRPCTTPPLEQPVLVLWGNRDPYLLPPTSDELDLLARRHTIRVLAGGHWLQREIPDRINALIADFIAGGELG